ncbi:hypothetical protein [Streptoalloteichus tenebrarius]|uniref:hypothetical protein n=1 Tax=Streptoalloteichus tenebrarius (strain ATCC 17920 / DSM 40477 / JCM 4838 / CBS 697.72 / NBRC 16177 / NCIMB 11028 / NRRL B-12390 / A12253. 1 / ISP 5477) TaxID=1933 RepID=UPI0020A32DDF|nr:hypothetical protein [Streptoalloteichus tenebrarius]
MSRYGHRYRLLHQARRPFRARSVLLVVDLLVSAWTLAISVVAAVTEGNAFLGVSLTLMLIPACRTAALAYIALLFFIPPATRSRLWAHARKAGAVFILGFVSVVLRILGDPESIKSADAVHVALVSVTALFLWTNQVDAAQLFREAIARPLHEKLPRYVYPGRFRRGRKGPAKGVRMRVRNPVDRTPHVFRG